MRQAQHTVRPRYARRQSVGAVYALSEANGAVQGRPTPAAVTGNQPLGVLVGLAAAAGTLVVPAASQRLVAYSH
jgi:hypothetical protein